MLGWGRPLRVLGDDSPGDRGGQERVAGGHDPDRVDQLLGWGVLEQEAAGTGPEGLEHVVVPLEGGEDDDPAPQGRLLADPSGGLQAVHLRHLDVHEHDIGLVLPGHDDGLLAVACLADDLQVVLGLQDHSEPGSHHRLVVGEHDADRHVPCPFNGKVAWTAKPPCRRARCADGRRGGSRVHASRSGRGRLATRAGG